MRHLAVSLVIILCQAGPGQCHLGRRVIPVWELPADGVDIRDATVEDWEDLVPEPSLEPVDFEGLRYAPLIYRRSRGAPTWAGSPSRRGSTSRSSAPTTAT